MITRSENYRGVLRRCSCVDGKDANGKACEHWSYSVEVVQGGKRRQRTGSGFKSELAASRARAKVAAAAQADELPADDKITFGEYLAKWLGERIDAGELRPSTARSYRDLADQHLIPRVGQVKLAKLRGHHLTTAYREIVADRKRAIAEAEARNAKWFERNPTSKTRPVPVPRAISPTTVRRVHAVASGALSAATKGSMIPANPAPNAELPKATKSKLVPWTPEQYSAFLAAVTEHRLYAAFHVIGHTGLRRGEAAGLRWSDVDFASGRLTVRTTRVSVGYAVHEGEAKSDAGQGRTVPLDAGTVEILKAHAGQQLVEQTAAGEAYEDGGWLFADELGRPVHPETLTKTFKRLAERAGLPSTKLHALRHFFVAAMISSGRDLGMVSKMAGHASVQVTADIYGSLFDGAAKDATEGVAALVRGAGQ